MRVSRARGGAVGLAAAAVCAWAAADPGARAGQPRPVQAADCGSMSLRAYAASGTYARNLRDAAARALEIVERTPPPNPDDDGPRPAIVIDVDDTALSTLAMLDEGNFCITAELFARHVLAAEMPAIPPVLEVFRAARARGIAVFFITGRGEVYRGATERNLAAQGYEGYAEVFLKPADWAGEGSAYKTQTRRAIEERAYRIVLNVGDQLADLRGGHAEHEVLIPNPFYISR